MNVPNRRGKRYAIFDRDVSKEDIYEVDTSPTRFFDSKRLANKYVKQRNLTGVKIYKY